MSKMARSTFTLPTFFTPPIRSEAFWVCAKNFACALVAPLVLKAYTPVPRADGLVNASACTEMNKSACNLRAVATRTPKGMNTSWLRVKWVL